MFRRGLALCVVLGFASVANAGAVINLTMSDMGSLDGAAPPNVCCWTDLPAPVGVYPGDQFMVHAFMTTDTTLPSGARMITLDATGPATTVPYDWLGVDANTNNQFDGDGNPVDFDGIPNFWFDYTQVTTVAGRFQVQGEIELFQGYWVKTSAGYTDFSNVILQETGLPGPLRTAWADPGAGTAMFFLEDGEPVEAGVPVHVGAMVVTVPGDATVGETYALDLLNSSATDLNWGARLDFDFTTPTEWTVPNGMMDYAQGAGPAVFTVIPEPATLLLLGLGGVAALRRRR